METLTQLLWRMLDYILKTGRKTLHSWNIRQIGQKIGNIK